MASNQLDIRLMMGAFDAALDLLPRIVREGDLPADYRELSRKILLVVLEPNEKHGSGDAVSGYDEEGHRVFIAYYCPAGELPNPRVVTFAYVHELAHIFLGMDEEAIEPLTLRAAGELGLDVESSGERDRDYAARKHVWNEDVFPYLGVLREEVGPEEARARILEMSERGFDFSI